jgi:WD40 repeat protein
MYLTVLFSLVVGSFGAPPLIDSDHTREFASCLDCDGRHLVGFTQSKKLVVWDASTGRAIRTLMGYRDPIYLARLLPDGESVLGQSLDPHTDWATWGISEKGLRDRSMRLWNIRSGRTIWRIADSLYDGLSSDGQRVYGVASKVSPNLEKPRLVCWDLRTGASIFTMPDFVPRGFLTNIAQETADGRRLLYSDPSGITVFDLESRKMLLHIDSTRLLGAPPAALVGDGSQFFCESPPGAEGTIALYGLPDNKVVDSAKFPHGRRPLEIGWLPNSAGFVAFCNGRWVSYRKGEGLVDRGDAGLKGPMDIIASPDEQSFAAWYATALGGKRTFAVQAYDAMTCIRRWERPGLAVKFLPNGQLVVEDGDAISFVDMATGVAKRTIHLEGFFDNREGDAGRMDLHPATAAD